MRRYGAPRAAWPQVPLLLSSLLMACDPNAAARFPTRAELPDEERRPDGIAVDLRSDPPPTRDRADGDAGIVTLRAPLGIEAAHETLRKFFNAMVAEDITAMTVLTDPSTVVVDTRQGRTRGGSSEHRVSHLWSQRFRKREYQLLASLVLYREADVMTYRGDDIDALPLSVRYLPAADDGEPTDIVLRVPITTHTIKNERLLGDELFFWLRRTKGTASGEGQASEGDSYVIFRMAEDIPF